MSSKLDLSKEFSGRRALITGGTRGIGAAIAQRLLDAGAQVVVSARSRNEATPAAATFIAGDVGTNEGAQAIATEALAALGGLDILVNNAGVQPPFTEGRRRSPTRSGRKIWPSTSWPRSALPTRSSRRSVSRRPLPS